MYLNCEIFVESLALTADLMLLDIVDFYVILGMDFLETHWAIFIVTTRRCCLEVLVYRRFCFVETRGPHRLVLFQR